MKDEINFYFENNETIYKLDYKECEHCGEKATEEAWGHNLCEDCLSDTLGSE